MAACGASPFSPAFHSGLRGVAYGHADSIRLLSVARYATFRLRIMPFITGSLVSSRPRWWSPLTVGWGLLVTQVPLLLDERGGPVEGSPASKP